MITLFTSVKFVILVKIFAVNRTIKTGKNKKRSFSRDSRYVCLDLFFTSHCALKMTAQNYTGTNDYEPVKNRGFLKKWIVGLKGSKYFC